MMKHTKPVLAVTCMAIMAFAATASAWDGFGKGLGGGRLLDMLTPDQQKQVQMTQVAFLKKIQPLRAELDAKKIEMRELMLRDSANDAAIQKKQEEIWSLQDRISNERRQMTTQIRSLLTPEQRSKLGPMMGFGFAGGRHGKGGWW